MEATIKATQDELNNLLSNERALLSKVSLEEAAALSSQAMLDFQYVPSVDQVDQVASPRSNLRAALQRQPVPLVSSSKDAGGASSRKTKTRKKRSKKSSSSSSSNTTFNTTSTTSKSKSKSKSSSSSARSKQPSSLSSVSSSSSTSFSSLRSSRTAAMKRTPSGQPAASSKLRSARTESRLTARSNSGVFSRPQSSSTVEDTLRIKELEHEVALLRSESERVKERHQKQMTESEIKATMYGAQVDRLAQQIETLVARNADTSAQKVEADMSARTAQNRADQLESNSSTLRKLLTELLGNPSSEKIRSMEEQNFWDQIATPEIMALSRPPSGYTVPSLEMVQAHPVYSQELDASRARLRMTNQELKKCKNDLENLQRQMLTVRAAASSKDTNSQAMIARQRKWLMGTVRRIKWVIKKREETEKLLSEREGYIGKLETKLLHQAMALRKQREALRVARSTGMRSSSSRTARGGAPRTVPRRNENVSSESNVSAASAAEEVEEEEMGSVFARESMQKRAEEVVGEIASSVGPPSPHLRKTLSSIMGDGMGHGSGGDEIPLPPTVAAVPMSPMKSPAPKKKEERTALDVLAEDEDGFDMEDIAEFTKTLTSEIQDAVSDQLKKSTK